MKAINLFLMVMLYSFITYGQGMATYDVKANLTLVEQLKKSAEQLRQSERTYETIKKTAEKVEKVNKQLKTIKDVQSIFKLQKETLSNIKYILDNAGNGKEKDNVVNQLTMITNTVTGLITATSKITTSGIFNMTDKERIDKIKEIRDKMFYNAIQTRKYVMRLKINQKLKKHINKARNGRQGF